VRVIGGPFAQFSYVRVLITRRPRFVVATIRTTNLPRLGSGAIETDVSRLPVRRTRRFPLTNSSTATTGTGQPARMFSQR
jgi:hypothetical protein